MPKPPPGEQIPDCLFHQMSKDWQDFISEHLMLSPLRAELSAFPDAEYLSACIDLLCLGEMQVTITDDYQFRIRLKSETAN